MREEERRPGDRRRLDVHRDRPDRRFGGAWVSDRSADRAVGDAPAAAAVRPAEVALLVSVFVVAACGLVYELAAGTLASYLLGDSILQFSTVIGTYLFAMGVGSWLSRYLRAPAGRAVPAHRAARRPDRRPDAGGAVRAAVAGDAVVPLRPVRARPRRRHPGRPRDPARHAHPEAPRQRRERRAEDAGLAGADVRLPRRARGVDRVSAPVRAAARPDPHRRVLRPPQRRRRHLGALAVSRRAARARRAMPPRRRSRSRR